MGFAGAAIASGFVLAVVAGLARVWALGTKSPREDEVLPAHYSSLLQFDRTRYPGHCPDCGTDNGPGYRFCEACGSAIPTTDGPPTDAEIRWIVDG